MTPEGYSFTNTVDEMILEAKDDPELLRCISLADAEAKERGISFYQRLYEICMESRNDS